MPIHIFFDNSNVWGGAQARMQQIEPNGHWAVLQLDYITLSSLIVGSRQIATGIFAASEGSNSNWIYAIAKACRLEPLVMKRVMDATGKFVEQGVDELLHLRICTALLDYAPPQTLIIVSGDGDPSDFGTSFPDQARRALEHGWDVEVWSWESVLKRSAYERMPEFGTPRLKIETFDQHYFRLTSLKSGQVFDKDRHGNPINGRFISARAAKP